MSIAASGRTPLAVAVGTVGCMEPIVTQGLTKRYGELFAVRELDLTVRAGEVYGFLGPNGAGKTTTLRMLLGLVRPTAGRVLLHGRPPGSLDGVGALIEGPAFYPYLSGRDNLRVLARHAAVPGKRVDVVLDLVDLSARAGRLHGNGVQPPARRGRADLRPGGRHLPRPAGKRGHGSRHARRRRTAGRRRPAGPGGRARAGTAGAGRGEPRRRRPAPRRRCGPGR